MLTSIKVTMDVWRVIGRTTIWFLRPLNSTFCSQVINKQPLRVLKTYINIVIIHMPNVAGRMRYSGFVTTTPCSISG